MIRALAAGAVIVILSSLTVRVDAEPIGAYRTSPASTVAPVPATPSSTIPPPHAAPSNGATGTAQSADQALLERKLAELDRLQSEIDQLRLATRTPKQILVKVQVLEVNRTKLRRLGVDVARIVEDKTGKHIAATQIGSVSDAFDIRIVDLGSQLRSFLNALEKNRVAKVLAEPSIVVTSGRPASLNVGGELMVPAPTGSNQAPQFLSTGTKLDVLAVASGNGVTRLELRVRIAEPDYSRAIQIEGGQLPSIKVRQLDTAIELASGQTSLLTGLVQPRVVSIKTDSGIKTETEKIETWFLVTPEIVPTVAASPSMVR